MCEHVVPIQPTWYNFKLKVFLFYFWKEWYRHVEIFIIEFDLLCLCHAQATTTNSSRTTSVQWHVKNNYLKKFSFIRHIMMTGQRNFTIDVLNYNEFWLLNWISSWMVFVILWNLKNLTQTLIHLLTQHPIIPEHQLTRFLIRHKTQFLIQHNQKSTSVRK